MNDEITTSIRQRFKALKSQHRALLETADTIYEEMKRLRSAYFALTGKEDQETEMADEGARRSQSERRTQQAGKSTLPPEEIRGLIRQVLAEQSLTESEIRTAVGEIVSERDASRKGLHFVVRGELAKSGDFLEADGRWSLKPVELSKEQLIERVRDVLGELGPLSQPSLIESLRDREPAASQGLEAPLKKALLDGPFEFNGAKWELASE